MLDEHCSALFRDNEEGASEPHLIRFCVTLSVPQLSGGVKPIALHKTFTVSSVVFGYLLP